MLAAFAALISSLVAARAHRRKAKVLEAELDARHAPTVLPTTKVDASFEGFNLEVVPDTPSAWLLTPLRTGDWKPPEEPAPAASLPAVSLAERVKRFDQQPPGADLASAAPETPSPERTMLLENLPDVWPVTKVVGAHVEPLAEGAAAPPVPEPEGAAADAPLVPLPVPSPIPCPCSSPSLRSSGSRPRSSRQRRSQRPWSTPRLSPIRSRRSGRRRKRAPFSRNQGVPSQLPNPR